MFLLSLPAEALFEALTTLLKELVYLSAKAGEIGSDYRSPLVKGRNLEAAS